jgi:hypothetical protein
MSTPKQHYSFIFTNPENSIPETGWTKLFSGNKLKDDSTEKSPNKKKAPLEVPELDSYPVMLDRFFTIVENLMQLNK